MTERMSSAAFTILKTMAPTTQLESKPLAFEKAIQFNQVIFYALVRNSYIKLNLNDETFTLTKLGLHVFNSYIRGNPGDYEVKNDTPQRHERVSVKLGNRPARRKPMGKAKSVAA